MHRFRYRENELYCENVPVRKIAEQVNTPFYLYSQQTIVDHYNLVDQAFSNFDHLICYAVKANANPEILSLLASQGAGADVVSRGEIYLALQNGFPAEKIVFAGVGKRPDEIEYALERKIYSFHVESEQELELINQIAQKKHQIARIALRINPDIEIHGHPYISTGKAIDKFGIEVKTVKELIQRIHEFSNIALIGLHCHIGSQVTEIKPYGEALQVLNELVEEIQKQGIELQYVDMGGGLGVRYKNVMEDPHGIELSPKILVESLRPQLECLNTRIIFEPGRFIVAQAGVVITRVLYLKETAGHRFVIVDAGMNDLIRPSLYEAYHEIVAVHQNAASKQPVDVVGPICESGDFLGKERWLPVLHPGDLLAVMTAGAYGFVLSSNYNARPLPAEVMVHDDTWEIIRPEQDLQNLWT
ncbi:MAG: diaminopimelate decarboxylase [Calditrichaeota bacterium]|nr:MAG: diaminopimelate decarboxylase [Calditrichota bacterium]